MSRRLSILAPAPEPPPPRAKQEALWPTGDLDIDTAVTAIRALDDCYLACDKALSAVLAGSAFSRPTIETGFARMRELEAFIASHPEAPLEYLAAWQVSVCKAQEKLAIVMALAMTDGIRPAEGIS